MYANYDIGLEEAREGGSLAEVYFSNCNNNVKTSRGK